MDRLILFDIDATLLVTGGVGIAAMVEAGRRTFARSFTADGIDFAGRLDPLLLAELLALNGVASTPQSLADFKAAYLVAIAELAHPDRPPLSRALPGVHALLARLRADGVAMGLLTGNFSESGSIKLRACGIDPNWFSPAVWGDHSPHTPPCRTHLPAIAMDRYRSATGRDLAPELVTIIGDTPHDIRCARHSGCRAVAVATGKYSATDLARAGADAVLNDLSDTDLALAALFVPPSPSHASLSVDRSIGNTA